MRARVGHTKLTYGDGTFSIKDLTVHFDGVILREFKNLEVAQAFANGFNLGLTHDGK